MVKVSTRSGRTIRLRRPVMEDAVAVHALIASCPPLDLNSTYAYLLQALHFAETCVVAEDNGMVAGYLSAYIPYGRFSTLFVWQIAVTPAWRGEGVARLMLHELLGRTASRGRPWLETTINPSNEASCSLFYSLARELHVDIQTSPLLEEKLFGDEAHEAEHLYRLGPLALTGADWSMIEKGKT